MKAMTDVEWNESVDPIAMLKTLQHVASDYKLRCFNSAWDSQFPTSADYGILSDQPWNYAWGIVWEADPLVQQEAKCSLLREIFGNPFRLMAINRDSLTSNIVGFAQAIDDGRAFDRMPELADGLVATGCDNDDILNHCRSKEQHVRGCWVVDLILGKE